MAKYLITVIGEKNDKQGIALLLADANSKRQATTRFWQGEYTTLIDNGGKVLSLVITKLNETDEEVWKNFKK